MSLSNPFDVLEEKDISKTDMLNFFSYDSKTGFLTWNRRDYSCYENAGMCDRWNNFYAGQRAGTLTCHGYLTVKIFGKIRRVHRIIWLIENGSWPEYIIDHVNGDRSDNRIENLRSTDSLGNMRNRKTNKNTSSGFRGVYFNKREKKWRSHIKNCGNNIHIGYFDSFEEAVNARIISEKELGFHENHGRVVNPIGAI